MPSSSAEQNVSVPMLRAAWETMTFLHWRVAPARIQSLLPPGLTCDLYEGSAWLGLTPFVMANMKSFGIPLSSTPETNLRTYVRGPDGRQGLWFLSLDIGTALLAVALRGIVGAPYYKARLSVDQQADTVVYTGERLWGPGSYRLRIRPGTRITPSDLENWLVSRWCAYTTHLDRLVVTPVEHEPWPLREATLESIEHNLTHRFGLTDLGDPPLVHFSDGVQHVRLGRPALVALPGVGR